MELCPILHKEIIPVERILTQQSVEKAGTSHLTPVDATAGKKLMYRSENFFHLSPPPQILIRYSTSVKKNKQESLVFGLAIRLRPIALSVFSQTDSEGAADRKKESSETKCRSSPKVGTKHKIPVPSTAGTTVGCP